MDVTISTFNNPFSFFCKVSSDAENKFELDGRNFKGTSNFSKVAIPDQHGQYVAVLHENKWVRGVVSVEDQLKIWLIDYGVYIRPNEKTIHIDLPAEYKNLPTKVFEASIHGVSPVDKVLTYMCQYENEISTKWTPGTTVRCLELIKEASKLVFVPVALLTTASNDIVIGNLFLKLGEEFVNIIDKLETWPFLQRNEENYIQCLKTYYGSSSRKHRANRSKPEIPNKFKVASMTEATSLAEYRVICAAASHIEDEDASVSGSAEDTDSDLGTSSTYGPKIKKEEDLSCYQLTPAQEKEYASMWITLGGKDYNFLTLVRDKLEVFKTCEKYKNIKYIGRATGRRPYKGNKNCPEQST